MNSAGSKSRLAPLALTVGEPSGIASEITLRAWLLRESHALPCFFLLDEARWVAESAKALGLDVPIREIERPEQAHNCFNDALPILSHGVERDEASPGHPSPANAPAIIRSIERAVTLAQDGHAAAVVTNPINKKSLMDYGFAHPGHTEYLGELAGPGHRPVMMLVSPALRVIPVTVHVPLSQVPDLLTREAIETACRTAAQALKRDFGIAEPRIAVSGLNPHAGEQGNIGREEIEIINPAIAAMKAEGLSVFGPVPGDTLFHAAARETYDVALCMYHDQALIPLKTLDFDRGVNVTLGLPFIRTSPDHGTALGIAGKGMASPISLIESLKLAGQMAYRRSWVDAA